MVLRDVLDANLETFGELALSLALGKNAVKTGLTGRTILLLSEDTDAYEMHLLQHLEEYASVGLRETQLVQNLAATQ